MEWIDLALIGDEAALNAAIAAMTPEELDAALGNVADALGMEDGDLLRGALRVLIERARPLALPAQLWRRPITASSDPGRMVTDHFRARGIAPRGTRVKDAQAMYTRFVEERNDDLRLRASHLKAAGYRCAHCGLQYHNEELLSRTLESPFKFRRKQPVDDLKPHWGADPSLREPTLDHDWPVSLFGDNTATNLRVLCKACNNGKEATVALQHLRPWVGLPNRLELLTERPVSVFVFYAQLRRAPTCWKTGMAASDVELTVELIDPTLAPVIDNLRTVALR